MSAARATRVARVADVADAAREASAASATSARRAARAVLAARVACAPLGASPPLHINCISPSPAPSGATRRSKPSTRATLSHAPPAAVTTRARSAPPPAPPPALLHVPPPVPPPRRGPRDPAAPTTRGGPAALRPHGLPRSCTAFRQAASVAAWPRGRLQTAPRLHLFRLPRSCTLPAPRCISVSHSQASSARAGLPRGRHRRRRPFTTPGRSRSARAARSARLMWRSCPRPRVTRRRCARPVVRPPPSAVSSKCRLKLIGQCMTR